ncbi:hypothetical protein HYX12_03615 [Candidatus Woesearchaeota archaeon]|nr:hypothetical protein [Candidatus Woesearchaeota archaeon]
MVDEKIFTEVMDLRSQGLTDNVILNELNRLGYSQREIQAALAKADYAATQMQPLPSQMPSAEEMPMPEEQEYAAPMPSRSMPSGSGKGDDDNIYERIEEITESMIDEKWDELIAEVKKIVRWKEQVEEKQTKMAGDLERLKEDFKVLHQGVLGKLEDYDTRMRDVGTELKAVGKVFKEVIPEFVDNVKELKEVKDQLKKK